MFMGNLLSRSLSNFFEEFVDRLRIPDPVVNRDSRAHEYTLQTVEEAQQHPMDGKAVPTGPAVVPVIEDPEPWFVKLVQHGLRKLPDYVTLGQSPLTDCVGVTGESPVIRGKQLHELLHAGIESLRPKGIRPVVAPPRDWYNYIILHDAYVRGVKNRDLMARLYISEGTFNRTRRNAIRGVAMWLLKGMRQTRNIH